MAKKKAVAESVIERKPRADASRNRELILEAAKATFARNGAGASLDCIAKQAGVGPGTLYRHFPTRDALIEAVYRAEVEKLSAAQKRLAAEMEPVPALRAWMLSFIDHVAEKKLIYPAMQTVEGGSERLLDGARPTIQGAFLALADRAVASGGLRADVQPTDMFRALVGVIASMSPGWEESARRLVEILIAGSVARR